MHSLRDLAYEILTHDKGSRRNKRRVDHKNKGGDEDFKDRTVHPWRNSINPLTDDFIDLPFQFSDQTLDILEKAGLWESPENCGHGFPKGRFRHEMLQPKRHMGVVTPGSKEEMSSTNPTLFAFTRSMSNLQVVTETSGCVKLRAGFFLFIPDINLFLFSVSRYVVKVSPK